MIPFYKGRATTGAELNSRKLQYIALLAPTFIYNAIILIRVLIQRLEEAKYVLIVVMAVGCYSFYWLSILSRIFRLIIVNLCYSL